MFTRVFKLQRDEPFDPGDYICVGDIINDLLQYANADEFSPEIFPHAFTLAARRVERKSGKVAPAAEKAYRELTAIHQRPGHVLTTRAPAHGHSSATHLKE